MKRMVAKVVALLNGAQAIYYGLPAVGGGALLIVAWVAHLAPGTIGYLLLGLAALLLVGGVTTLLIHAHLLSKKKQPDLFDLMPSLRETTGRALRRLDARGQGSIQAGGDIAAGSDITAASDIRAGGNIAAGGNMTPARSEGEQAQAIRCINAAKPLVKRLKELFYRHGDRNSGWRGGDFNTLFVDTYLAPPASETQDHYAWLLPIVNEKMILNAPVEEMEKAMKEYERSPSDDRFRALAEAIALVCRGANEWVTILVQVLNDDPERLARRREVFREWMPRYNEMVGLLAAFSEEAYGIGLVFFSGEFFMLVERGGKFQFNARSSVRSG
ncbi:MAG TPA: hypothetical protein VM241_06800 [Candidatus Thermoplasmatota archaeon]|nr:hypothetical protein [Candidatus Thermoplasmatota archaeon]